MAHGTQIVEPYARLTVENGTLLELAIRAVGHLMKSWKPYGTRFLFLAVACVVYLWFSPDLESAKTLSLGWIWEILFRNIVLITIIAGGLHVVLWAKNL